jgi:hypothetical protein
MTSPVELDLSTQRYVLQQQLRAQRQQIIEQFNLDAEARPHFPRSATMRFLCGRAGTKFLTEVMLRKFGVRYPGTMANLYSLVRLFANKKI